MLPLLLLLKVPPPKRNLFSPLHNRLLHLLPQRPPPPRPLLLPLLPQVPPPPPLLPLRCQRMQHRAKRRRIHDQPSAVDYHYKFQRGLGAKFD